MYQRGDTVNHSKAGVYAQREGSERPEEKPPRPPDPGITDPPTMAAVSSYTPTGIVRGLGWVNRT